MSEAELKQEIILAIERLPRIALEKVLKTALSLHTNQDVDTKIIKRIFEEDNDLLQMLAQ